MLTDIKTTVLFREDLIRPYRKRPINEIELNLFIVNIESSKLMHQSNVVMFVDINGDTKILKNRYGKY